MKKTMISVIAVLATIGFISPSFADDKQTDKSYKQSTQKEYQQKDKAAQYDKSDKAKQKMGSQAQASQSASKLLGKNIYSQKGEAIGELQDINFDLKSGRVNYLTITKGGILGVGEEEIAIPMDAISFQSDQDQIRLQVDQSKLENVPQQANMSDEEYTRELQSHYGVSPAWQQEDRDREQQMMDQKQRQQQKMMDEENKQQKNKY